MKWVCIQGPWELNEEGRLQSAEGDPILAEGTDMLNLSYDPEDYEISNADLLHTGSPIVLVCLWVQPGDWFLSSLLDEGESIEFYWHVRQYANEVEDVVVVSEERAMSILGFTASSRVVYTRQSLANGCFRLSPIS